MKAIFPSSRTVSIPVTLVQTPRINPINNISNCFLGGKYKRDGVAAVEKQCKFAPALIHLMMGFDIETEWSICSLIPTHLSKSYPSFRVQLRRSLLPDTYAGSSSPAITRHTPIPFVC